jgi:hypothetical protein
MLNVARLPRAAAVGRLPVSKLLLKSNWLRNQKTRCPVAITSPQTQSYVSEGRLTKADGGSVPLNWLRARFNVLQLPKINTNTEKLHRWDVPQPFVCEQLGGNATSETVAGQIDDPEPQHPQNPKEQTTTVKQGVAYCNAVTLGGMTTEPVN